MRTLLYRFLLLASCILLGQSVLADDYYWVNGAGLWNDYANHWATASGDTNMHSSPPGPFDQVFFDSLSFSAAGQVVTIDTTRATCSRMDWSTALFVPTFTGNATDTLDINGSCRLIADMGWAWPGLTRFLISDAGDDTLDLAEQLFAGEIYLEGNGSWLANSDLKTLSRLWFRRGTLTLTGDSLLAEQVWLRDPENLVSFNREFNPQDAFMRITGNDSAWVTQGSTTFTGGLATATFSYVGAETITLFTSPEYGPFAQVILPPSEINLEEGMHATLLTIAPGASLQLPPDSNLPLRYGAWVANGNCGAYIRIRSAAAGSTAYLDHDPASALTASFLRLQDLDILAGTLTANSSLDDGNLGSDITVNEPTAAQTFYWINEGGNWHDTTHWSLASGGPISGCLPGPRDTVRFDANSFSAADTVVLDRVTYCADWDAGALGQNVVFTGAADRVQLNGSLTLSPLMELLYTGEWRLQGGATHSLTSAGLTFPGNVIFSGTGAYTQTDALVSDSALYLFQGDWIANEQPVQARAILGEAALTATADFSNTAITLTGADTVWWIPAAQILDLAGAAFDLTHAGAGEAVFEGEGRAYDTLRLNNAYTRLGGENQVDYLFISSNHSLSLPNGRVQEVDSIDLVSDCQNLFFLQATTPSDTVAAFLRKGGHNALVLDYVVLNGVAADTAGGRSYQATNSVGFNTVDGWNISGGGAGTHYYWIGGTGDWSDPTHWSLATGGPPAACLPGPQDTVIFDANSFLTAQDTVRGNTEAYFARMDWTGVPGGENPVWLQSRDVYAGENILLCPTLTHLRTGSTALIVFQPDGNDALFQTEGVPLLASVQLFAVNGTDTLRLGGDLVLSDSLSSLLLTRGALLTEGFDVQAGIFFATTLSPKYLALFNSELQFSSGWLAYLGPGTDTLFTIDAGSSHIFIGGGSSRTFFQGGFRTYYDLTIRESQGEPFSLSQNNVFENLTLEAGVSYRMPLDPTTNAQVVNQDFTALGTCSDSISITPASGGFGLPPTLTLQVGGNVFGQCLRLRETTLSGAATGATIFFSRDIQASNAGWDFSALSPATADFTAPATVCLEDSATFTSTSTVFSGNPADLSLLWDYDDGTTDSVATTLHSFPNSGTYDVSLVAEYLTNGCRDTFTQAIEVLSPVLDVAFDPTQTQICENELITFTIQDNPSTSYDFYRDSLLVQTGADTVFVTDSVQQGEVYYVESTVNGCAARSDSFTFLVTPAPLIPLSRSSGGDTICAGDSVWFYTSGGDLYRWYINDSLFLTTLSDSILLTSLTNGQEVRVEGRGPGTSCFGRSPSFGFVVNPLPDLTLINLSANFVICEGEPVNLAAAGAASYTFLADTTVLTSGNTTGIFSTTTLQNGQTVSIIGETLGCQATASLPVFSVKTNPTASLVASDTTICEGDAVLLTASGAPTYQFLLNGTPTAAFSGANTFLNSTLSQGDQIEVVALLNGCTDTSATITFQVNALPTVSLSASVSDTLCQGDSITFTASGASVYDFLVNGNPAVSQTASPTFGTSSLLNGQTVTVIGYAQGCPAPAPQSFSYVVKPLPSVSVFKSSAPNEICLGDSSTFVATGATSYEFLVNGQSQGSSGMSNPFTASSLPVGNPIITALGTLNGCIALSSNSATVEVKPLPTVGLTLAPNDTSLCLGDTVLFTASGATNYQFLIDGIAQGPSNPIDTFLISTLQDGQTVVVVGEEDGCSSPSNEDFTFSVGAPPVLSLSSDDPDQVICEGTPVVFQASGAQVFSFFVDGVLQQGPAPTSSLTLGNLQNGQTISLTGETNGCEATAGQALTFTVNPLPVVSLTSSDPDSSICAGESVSFLAAGGINYQFLINGSPIGNTGPNAQFQTPNLQDGQVIQVIGFSNQNCPDTSSSIAFEVLPIPVVSLTTSANGPSLCEGDTVTFTAAGASLFTFFLDGNSLNGPSPQSTYTTDSLQSGQTLTVAGLEGACAAEADTSYTYTVNQYPTVSLTADPADLTICQGEALQILGAGAPTYQLFLNGVPNGPATASNLFAPTTLQNGDVLTLLGINQGCERFADTSLTATVFSFPTQVGLSSSDADQVVCLYDTVLFTGSGADSYLFFVNGFARDTLSSPWSFGGLRQGDQVSVIGSNGGCETASNDVLTFTVNRLSLSLTASPTLIVCEGEPVTFTADGGDLYEFFVDGSSQGGPNASNAFTLSSPSDGQEVTFSATSNSTGCVQPALATRRVRVLERPDLIYTGLDSVCQGDTTVLFAQNLPTQGNLRWLQDGLPLAGAFVDSLLVTESGTYAVASTLGGTQQVWTQGGNERGQLGDTTTVDRPAWLATTPADEPYAAIAAGESHTLAAGSNGTLYGWGSNGFGQLGLGTFGDETAPVPVAGLSSVETVAAGKDFSLVLRQNGAVFSFGANGRGQLGLGNTAVSNFPFQINLSQPVSAVAAGESHALALLVDGTVLAWGANESGQLGNGSFTDRLSPGLVPGLSHIVAIAAGNAHSLALDDQGRLWVWGSNARGQLGLGTISAQLTPTQLTLFTVPTAIAAGGTHSLFVDADGLVWTTGANDRGQLGTGGQQDQLRFRSINAPGDGQAVFGGYDHSLLLLGDGSVWGWGENTAQELLANGASALLDPTYLPEATGATQLAAGLRHSVALLDNFQECASDDQPITVQVAPVALIDRQGDLLTAEPTGVSYQWFLNGVPFFNQDTATIKMLQNGTYQVEITYANGCSRLSEPKLFFTTDLASPLLASLSFYPNPTESGIAVSADLLSAEPVSLMLMDARGRTVGTWREVRLTTPFWVDLSALAEGMYVLRVMQAGQHVTVKVQKR